MSRPLAGVALVLSVVVLFAATRTQAFTYVSIDGRMVRLLVTGDGPATVVLESGLGGPLENWGKVQPAVSTFARTLSYDRAGVGLSAAAPGPRDARSIAVDLHRALHVAHVAPPYILVGASLGGPYVRVFAGLYPDEVAGMVLVDPTPDSERLDRAVPRYPELDALPATLDQARASMVPRGIPVFLIDAVSPTDVPFATDAIRRARMTQREGIAAESHEYKAWLDTVPTAHLVVTNESGHNVAQEQPQLVIDTIRKVVERTARRQP